MMATESFGGQIEQIARAVPQHRLARIDRAWDDFLRNTLRDEETRQSLLAEFQEMLQRGRELGEIPPMTFDWE